MPKLTDNSAPPEKFTAGDMRPGGNAAGHLLSFVERIERVEDEQRGLADDKKEIYSEINGVGFDTAVIRKMISRRKMDKADRMELDSVLELYEETVRQEEAKALRQSEDEAV